MERHFSRDLLLANVTLYWVTGTANAANRSYYERAREPRRITTRITVPTGVALSTEAVQRVPRERAERSYAGHPAMDRVPARRPLLRGGGASPPGGGAPRLLPPVPRDELGGPHPGVEGGQEGAAARSRLAGALVALNDAQEGRARRAVTRARPSRRR